MPLKPHQERVIAEKRELDEKREKLNEFARTRTFEELPKDEQDRLDRQAKVMDEYSVILGERIAAWEA